MESIWGKFTLYYDRILSLKMKAGMILVNVKMKLAVVIPCYRVRQHILKVLSQIGPEVSKIYVVDDCCPESSGKFVLEGNFDSRVEVIFHKINLGVGGAVISGYKKAINDGMDIIVKVDGDGQMDPSLIARFAMPIARGEADYTKGNRFFDLSKIGAMPPVRIIGNAALSFITKLSSGYWEQFDPTNGYTAIHARVAKSLPFDKISHNYFFESDMLFRLNILRAAVMDVPMDAVYEDEVSGLKVRKILGLFLVKNVGNFFKRIFYNYYLRGLSIASFELPFGIILLTFGSVYGFIQWGYYSNQSLPTPAGTVMLSALTILMGFQLLLAFISYDINSSPRTPIWMRLTLKEDDCTDYFR